ncbi:type II secretion system protein, partial [Aeromicrobium sp.]|nr:type II secretion system protein [Candidatus Saccharibacteria bacterium]
MLHKVKNRKQEGFTIIEVLIVLAIAGLIIAIVLLAVPALQRNGRNTAMKTDANAIAGGVSEFKSNNEGRLPNVAGVTGTAPDIAITNSTLAAGGAAPAAAKVQTGTVVTAVTAGPGAYTAAQESTVYVVIG